MRVAAALSARAVFARYFLHLPCFFTSCFNFPRKPSARWPRHRPAAKHVRVYMVNGLACLGTRVKDHSVSSVGDALGNCDLVRLGCDLGKQAGVGYDSR